jgi:hypothetical protein
MVRGGAIRRFLGENFIQEKLFPSGDRDTEMAKRGKDQRRDRPDNGSDKVDDKLSS